MRLYFYATALAATMILVTLLGENNVLPSDGAENAFYVLLGSSVALFGGGRCKLSAKSRLT